MIEEYLSRFPDGTLVRWKALTWEEYSYLLKIHGETLSGAAGWLLCEAAAALCILDQDQDGIQVEQGDLYAGTIYTVGRQILEFTGFIGTVDKVKLNLAKAREKVQNDWYESALALVCSIFHKDEDEVRKWTLKKFMNYCAKIEIVTGQPLPISDDNAEEGTQKRKYVRGPDGRPIPVLTKQDLRRQKIDMNALPTNDYQN